MSIDVLIVGQQKSQLNSDAPSLRLQPCAAAEEKHGTGACYKQTADSRVVNHPVLRGRKVVPVHSSQSNHPGGFAFPSAGNG